MATPAYLSLGSNVGDRAAHLDAAVAALVATPGVTVLALSRYHETAPVGGPPGQGAFLNAAAALATTLGPHSLHDRLRAIEDAAGRLRRVRWDRRTLDLDLLLHGDTILDAEGLRVPHSRMAVRRFVLAPLAEIAPDAIDPLTGESIRGLLERLDQRPGRLAIVGGTPGLRAEIASIVRAELADIADGWIVEPDDPEGVRPTFVAGLGDGPNTVRRPGPDVILHVEAADPSAAAEEIVAACRAARP